MDKEQAINLAKRYKEMVAEKLPLKALYLYGSYSKGNYRADSDIDIAVIVERLDDDYFKDTPLLWKLRRKISNLIGLRCQIMIWKQRMQCCLQAVISMSVHVPSNNRENSQSILD